MPPPPRAAYALFGRKLPQVQKYAQLLHTAGVERGLIGPSEAERLWDRHLLNCGVVTELIPVTRSEPVAPQPVSEPGIGEPPVSEPPVNPEAPLGVAPGIGDRARGSGNASRDGGWGRGTASVQDRRVSVGQEKPVELADLGSGAGLPGLVLAILLPQVRVILVEPMGRRATFLLECTAELGLGNVQVRRGRAEDLTGEIQADVVTSRAVARLDRLAVLAAGLARPGGLVLAIKGATARHELDRALPVLRRIGATGAEIVSAGAGLLDQPTTVVRFQTRHSSELGSRRGCGGARV